MQEATTLTSLTDGWGTASRRNIQAMAKGTPDAAVRRGIQSCWSCGRALRMPLPTARASAPPKMMLKFNRPVVTSVDCRPSKYVNIIPSDGNELAQQGAKSFLTEHPGTRQTTQKHQKDLLTQHKTFRKRIGVGMGESLSTFR